MTDSSPYFRDEDHMNQIIELVRADAAKKRESAAYGGEMHDGGAGAMEREIDFFLCGRAQVIPNPWKKYDVQLDPEYPEYQRLKKKFEQ